MNETKAGELRVRFPDLTPADSRRFTLGERLESGLLYVLERLVEAAYSRAPVGPLRTANLRLQVVRHLWRLAHEMRVIPTRRYVHGAELMVDLGRQVGAWHRNRSAAGA